MTKRENICLRRDPNHFSKTIKENANGLEVYYPELAGLGNLLKGHFISTIRMKLNAQAWRLVWLSFLNHNCYGEHSQCRHLTLDEDHVPYFSGLSPRAITALQGLIESIANMSSLFLHKTHTNGNESVNGMGHSRANKRLNRDITGEVITSFSLLSSENILIGIVFKIHLQLQQ